MDSNHSLSSSAPNLSVHINNLSSPISSYKTTKFHLFHRRWIFLLLFSSVALFNNLICFTFAPIADQSYRLYGTSFPLDMLITVFFIVYCITTFPASRFIEVMGLRNGVLLGAWLQAFGCGIRCLTIEDGGSIGKIYMVLTGQIIASMGQAFFLNPPPLFASTWFGDTERALATSIACNANSLGIAAAYIISPLIVKDFRDIPTLLQIIAIISTGLAIIVTFLFEEAPPSPPSYSAFTKRIKVQKCILLNFIFFLKLATPNTPFNNDNRDSREEEELEEKLEEEDLVFEYSDDEEDEIEDNGVEFKYIKDVFVDRKLFSTFKLLLADYGFLSTMIAFAVAEACGILFTFFLKHCLVNGFSTFMNDFLIPEGFTARFVSLMGSLFIISAMIGSSIASYIVDKYKCFKLVLISTFLYFDNL